MNNKMNRSGTSQNDRGLKELRADYVSVEERSIVDLLMYLREYGEKVRFYSGDQQLTEFWSDFLPSSDDEIRELADSLRTQICLAIPLIGLGNTPSRMWPFC